MQPLPCLLSQPTRPSHLCRVCAAHLRAPARRQPAGCCGRRRPLVTAAMRRRPGKRNPTRWAVFSVLGFCFILAHGACSAACSWCADALWFRLIRWLGRPTRSGSLPHAAVLHRVLMATRWRKFSREQLALLIWDALMCSAAAVAEAPLPACLPSVACAATTRA